MPDDELHDGRGPTRPRGRRAAPAASPSPLAGAVTAVLAIVAASAAWVSRNRLATGVAVTALATAGMLAGGMALMQPAGGSAPEQEASTSIDDPRPTSTRPTAPTPYGPVLPTPVPPTSPPAETTPPAESVEPPVDDPAPEPTTAPEPGDDHPGQGKGPKKPR
ncbi:hypothetical protein [Agromyces subbeticus]|uniref:hypothetical protein n=1 Tax=Agromyces subbeticus TaxID=293890 RepID=UPI0012EB0C9A|nr:hypothetical protein [Agromyces subbeticus]